jgi:peptidoglycan L-alanyl-D-glutamate endopeptidase CwlK
MPPKKVFLFFVSSIFSSIPLLANALTAPSGLSASAACSRFVAAYETCNPGVSYDSQSRLVSLSPYTSRVACSDGKQLSFYDRLENMDFASQLSITYSAGRVALPNTVVNDDGGRLRFDPLFKEVYGRNANEVRQNLVRVRFLNQSVPFNRKNGAASALASVGVELLKAVKTDPGLAQHLRPWITGRLSLAQMTFNWRKIAPTNRLSNHSFGAAIDLNDLSADGPVYWLWDLASKRQKEIERRTGKKVPLADILKTIKEPETSDFKPTRIATTPPKLVEIFEKYGFIWGGKWFHFDSMHFEFRPEFFPNLHPSCAVPLTDLADAFSNDGELVPEPQSESDRLLQHYHWD